MPYTIAEEEFRNHEQIKNRCRDILKATSDGETVPTEQLPFLFALFQYHDEWADKSAGGVCGITVQTTSHGTRCFFLERLNGDLVDISFPHAIKCIPRDTKRERAPQGLLDYRAAARTAVGQQIRAFRDRHLVGSPICPISGTVITRGDCHVDHVAPKTFDSLLFDFTVRAGINPVEVVVGSREGTVAEFEDDKLAADWAAYHANHCKLRLLSQTGHAQLPAEKRNDWSPVLSGLL